LNVGLADVIFVEENIVQLPLIDHFSALALVEVAFLGFAQLAKVMGIHFSRERVFKTSGASRKMLDSSMTPQIILATVVLNLLAVFSAFGKTVPPVTFDSPCLAHGQHGVDRWTPKIDPSPVPWNKSKIQPITPSGIYRWRGPGPNVPLTPTTETRIPSEQKWYALTGRVVDAKVEADGDIHIALVDANGNNIGTVSAEIPVGPKWCEIRQTVFDDFKTINGKEYKNATVTRVEANGIIVRTAGGISKIYFVELPFRSLCGPMRLYFPCIPIVMSSFVAMS
jgi:hypothetical protein